MISRKVCLLGDAAVGKTSLLRRFVYNLFTDRHISTTDVKVSRKTVAIHGDDDIVELTMALWDVADDQEFDQVWPSYLRGTAGAVLVCDLTRPDTLDALHSYIDAVLRVNPGAQLILAGNKRDLADQRKLDRAQLEAIATDLNAPYYLTSAKTNHNVDALFRHMGRLLLAQLSTRE